MGNRRIRIGGSKLTMLVFLSREFEGKSTSPVTGRVTDLRSGKWGSKTELDVALKFMRYKQAPMFSFGVDVWEGKDAFGNPVNTPETIGKATAKRFYPMSISDSISLLMDDSMGDDFASSLYNIGGAIGTTFGAQAQIYEEKSTEPARKPYTRIKR